MRKFAAVLLPLLTLCTSAAFALNHSRHPSSHHASLRHTSVHGHAVAHTAAHHETARVMDSSRATEIQTALIGKGYMTGEPTGSWDAASVAAMQKLQGDNGWQTKITPDSRALIKLGLGPQQSDTASLQRP